MSTDFSAAVNLKANVSGTEAIDRLNKSLQDAGRMGQLSAKQLNQAYRQLPAQFQDIAVSLAGGQNPLMVLMQQGSQIATQFGGTGNAIKAMTGLLTPMRIGVTTVAAAFGTLAYAMYEGGKQSDELNNKLMLLGGAAGKSAGGFEQLIKEIDGLKGVTSGEARDIVTSLIGTFDATLLDKVGRSIVKISQLSGQTKADVTKDFATMTSGVAQWAATHNRAYNYLTEAQFKQIKSLEDMGNKEDAIRLNMKLLDEAFAQREVRLGTLERMWGSLKDAASGAWDAMLGLGRESTPEEKLADLQTKLANAQALKNRPLVSMMGMVGRADADIAQEEAIKQEIANLQEIVRLNRKAADIKAEAARKNQQGIDNEATGKNAANAAAMLSQQMALAEEASRKILRINEERQAKLDALHNAGLISDREYTKQKGELEQAGLQQQTKLLEAEIAIEKTRQPKSQADAIAKTTKLIELNTKLADAKAKAAQAGIKTEGEVAGFDLKESRQNAEDWAKSWKDAVEKVRDLALQNRRDANSLVTDPVARAREDIQIAIDEIKRKAAEVQRDLELQISLTLNPEQKALLETQLTDYMAQVNRAIELQNKKMPGTKTWVDGAKSALEEYSATAMDVAKLSQEAFANAFKGAEDALVEFCMTGKLSFRDLANSIIRDLIRIALQRAVLGPIAGALGGLLPSSTAATTLSQADYAAISGFDGGGYTGGGSRAGGLDGKGGFMAILHPQETVVDHYRGQSMGGGTTNAVTVNVNVETGSEQVNSNQGAGELGRAISAAVKAELINQKRPGGLLAA